MPTKNREIKSSRLKINTVKITIATGISFSALFLLMYIFMLLFGGFGNMMGYGYGMMNNYFNFSYMIFYGLISIFILGSLLGFIFSEVYNLMGK